MKKVIIGWVILLVLIALALIFFIWQDSFSFLPTTGDKWLGTLVVLVVALVLSHLHNLVFLMLNKVMRFNFKFDDKTHVDTDDKTPTKKKKVGPFFDITKRLRYQYGMLWRRRVRKCIVLGSTADTNLVLPDLIAQRFQLNDRTLMMYAGEIYDAPNNSWLKAMKKTFGRIVLLRRKPIDAMIWVLPANYLILNRRQQAELEQAIENIQLYHQTLGWKVPLYLVTAQGSDWSQTDRTEQSVGLLFNDLKTSNLTIDAAIDKLATQCSKIGMQQVMVDPRYAFLLQLSQNLVQQDKSRIKKWLTSWLAFPHVPTLRGLFFTPVTQHNDDEAKMVEALYGPSHQFSLTPTWQAITTDAHRQSGQRVGIQWGVLFCSLILVVMVGSIIGLSTAYYRNQKLIIDSSELVKQVEQTQNSSYTERLQKQYALQQQIDQLLYRQEEGRPLSYRFGLDHNNALLDKLWPYYFSANEKNIAGPLLAWQTSYLKRFTAMSPANPDRAKLVTPSYNVLKSYLMLTNPSRIDTNYLSDFATQMWPAPADVDHGTWQKLMPELVKFWGKSLQTKPTQAIPATVELVKDTRQILINQIGVQNAENTIYQGIIQRGEQQYANLTLVQLLGEIDSRVLFTSTDEIAGVFTRKAWENFVKNEINQAVKARQEQIDWVLSDGSQTISAAISPETLKQHLTDRYFNDYSAAWIQFLNNIQWRQATDVADVIEQLTLMSDVRQSPLIALVNTIKYQAEVAYTGGGISDNLLRTAKELISDKDPAKLTSTSEASGPLTPTFGPLLNLLNAENNNGLSLQTYLLRVTQVRLKLQNITSSANPQATAMQLAKSVFQGTSVDLTETRDYGNLITANLGEELNGIGSNLFIQPLDQAWQVILTPAANSFNDIWRAQIAVQWEQSFAGRYPFKNSDNDASFAELARFLRPNAGVIDRFIASELGGVLEKQGDSWVVNTVNAQGLHFSPQFIDALNLFSSLSNQMFLTGDPKMSFELMARSGNNIARSELIVDKQKLSYYNQMPAWQRFTLPGNDGYSPYAQMSWTSDDNGLKLYQYHAGDWGFIRLLESATIRQLDSSRYELFWQVAPAHNLKYILRTQSGEGPISLLKLRQFEFPKNVFLVQ